MEYIDMCCIVHLDDILIYLNTLLGHKQDVKNIFQATQKSGMRIKPSKCEFHRKETEYFGFIIIGNGLKADPVKTQAIWDWTTPKTKKEIQFFLGFCNFYRRFIVGFSRTAKPLYECSQKKYNGEWEWGEKEQEEFDGLRKKLTTTPVIVHFDPTARIKLETDASK